MSRTLAGERYELEDRLGHGGMATVYRAHDLKLDREVAIKLLADNLAGDDEVRKRFSREARLAARLDHPNVVQVFDVGEDEDRPYIVMEHVEGGTLEDRLNRRRRSVDRDEALRILGQLCEGLGHAHAKKLVHRDIKPQNLLLRDSDDCLKITDFGIARAAEETTRLTRPGKVVGTDRYMAPEQVADGRITPATDVYACGVVASELLPEARSPELHGIIARCLRDDPGERFSDATELGEALATVEGNGGVGVVRRIKSQGGATKPLPAGQATADWPAPAAKKPGRLRGRGLMWIALALLVVAAAAAGTVIAIDSSDSGSASNPNQERQAAPARVTVPRSDDPATQARQLGDFLKAQSRPGGASPQQP
jgi:Protein kinase domain